ncbi:RNA polymerase sigma factor [Paenibacillus aquistagni]|uniref:RNA polymerase sigma factor n=1 Tax=Paenibacillus aquistagni TaxID=1852522 RepID=A0A1X7K671_9BACL|nr:RNA polymerase sigma factor [Paenibacillus aquistagni]NMM53666.1 RNA polymerase sigma factor [Paenibacillus aquistagni]SMG36378.1 RNA polymerase sigma-70 factor, ECF subfamily [Paenibacillus aquistagni]
MALKMLDLQENHYKSLSSEQQKEIYIEFYKMFYAPILYIVKDHSLTEDIIQESFLKAIDRIPKVDNENKLKAWLKVVTKNTAINFLRKNKKNRNQVDLDSVFINDNADFATPHGTIEQEIELKAMVETIEQCLQQLKPEYRVMIELRWKRDMSYYEIADELSISEQKVKYTLHRAREAIKKRLVKEWGDHREKR